MQSRTSYFNKALFLNTLRRFWPLWLAYLAIWAIILPAVQAVNGVWGQTVYHEARDVLDICRTGGIVIGMGYGILSAMAVWSFLYNPKTMSGIASLPLKREGVYLCFPCGYSPCHREQYYCFWPYNAYPRSRRLRRGGGI